MKLWQKIKRIISEYPGNIMKKKYLALIPFLLIIYFYSPIHIKKYDWKNNGGGRISDYIRFDETNYFELKWPYIYKRQEMSGVIVFCFYDRLWVYSYKSGDDHGISAYVAKDQMGTELK